MPSMTGLATATLAALEGAMLLIRTVLVPRWRGAAPAEFREVFAASEQPLRATMISLGAAAAVSCALAALVPPRRGSPITAAAPLAVLAITAGVNEPANRRFAHDPTLGDAETQRLLDRWVRWHNVRLALGLIGLAASLPRRGRAG